MELAKTKPEGVQRVDRHFRESGNLIKKTSRFTRGLFTTRAFARHFQILVTMVVMFLARRFRTIVIAMDIFAFSDATSSKVLMTLRVHAFNTICAVATVIDLHPDITIGAIKIELTFLFTTIAFATAVHFLIVAVTFYLDSIVTVAFRFYELASHRRNSGRWRRRRRYCTSGRFLLLGFNVNRQCHCRSA